MYKVVVGLCTCVQDAVGGLVESMTYLLCAFPVEFAGDQLFVENP